MATKRKRRKQRARISMDAIEVLERVECDGPFHDFESLRELTFDDDDTPWTPNRLRAALDELLAAKRISRDAAGQLSIAERNDFCSMSTPDEDLCLRVRLDVKIFAGNPDMDFAVAKDIRAEHDLTSALLDFFVRKLREANGLEDKGPRRDPKKAAFRRLCEAIGIGIDHGPLTIQEGIDVVTDVLSMLVTFSCADEASARRIAMVLGQQLVERVADCPPELYGMPFRKPV